MKIVSWNANGIKSVHRNGHLNELVEKENPDVLCIQEIRTSEVPSLDGYSLYSFPSSKAKNFYGTAVYSKVEPISVSMGMDDEEFDMEGRLIDLEFESFNIINACAPSGGSSKERLERKYRFFDKFTKHLRNSKKPSIVCGDFNRIASEIDAKRPDLMKNRSGFLAGEQEWFKEILIEYVDAFRKFHTEGDNYTWWANKNLKAENRGLRLDYILVSKSLENYLTDSAILKGQKGSDHVPVALDISCCRVCGSLNRTGNEYCNSCGIKLLDDDLIEKAKGDKLNIAKDRIILLDLNYTLIANSREIRNYSLDKKIISQKYETELIDLIKNNYVILITASPYKRSHRILRDIREKTGFVPDESYWNFGGQPPQIKKYWMETEVLPHHGDNPERYLAIESNPATRRMYAKLGIEARPKGDFI